MGNVYIDSHSQEPLCVPMHFLPSTAADSTTQPEGTRMSTPISAMITLPLPLLLAPFGTSLCRERRTREADNPTDGQRMRTEQRRGKGQRAHHQKSSDPRTCLPSLVNALSEDCFVFGPAAAPFAVEIAAKQVVFTAIYVQHTATTPTLTNDVLL